MATGDLMNPLESLRMNLTRRHFFTQGSHLLGGMAIASLSTDQRLLQADASSGLSSEWQVPQDPTLHPKRSTSSICTW
jgi:hypothetical protein